MSALDSKASISILTKTHGAEKSISTEPVIKFPILPSKRKRTSCCNQNSKLDDILIGALCCRRGINRSHVKKRTKAKLRGWRHNFFSARNFIFCNETACRGIIEQNDLISIGILSLFLKFLLKSDFSRDCKLVCGSLDLLQF